MFNETDNLNVYLTKNLSSPPVPVLVKVKVKLSLYLTKHHAMKTYWRVEV